MRTHLPQAMNVLCVAAHPDDEVLGVGGTLRKHAEDGDTVRVVFLNDGVMSRYTEETPESRQEIKARKESARSANEILGVDSLSFNDFSNNRMDDEALLDIIKVIEDELANFSPHLIYTHHYGDLNIDHQLTVRAVKTATRPFESTSVERILAFETLSSTEWSLPQESNAFQPTIFNDISPVLEKKMAALSEYASEIGAHPHPRSLEAVRANAKVWGAKCGLNAAEPFVSILERHL
jgi:LmbE family N-acetylglucosaminyl deacetylase